MRCRPYLLMLTAIGFALGGSPARSQEKLVYAGECLGVLQSAVYTQHLALVDGGLTDQISERGLSALLILDGPSNQPAVFACPHRQTRLVALNLTGDDIDRLRHFARDELFIALTRFPSSGNKLEAIAELRQTVAGLPSERQETARRLVGARAAQLDLRGEEKKELSGFIKHYRDFDTKKSHEQQKSSASKKRTHK